MSVQERRDREREQRRQSILEAAERLFLSKGMLATVEEIAALAEVAKGTIYLYFPSKEDLYLTLVCKALDVMNGYFRAVQLLDLPPVEKIRRIGDAYIGFSREHPEYFRLLYSSPTSIRPQDVSAALYETWYSRSSDAWSIITGVLQDGIDRGVFRNDLTAFEMAIMLWNNTSGMLRQLEEARSGSLWSTGDRQFSIRQRDLERLLDISNAFLLTCIASPSTPLPAPRTGIDIRA